MSMFDKNISEKIKNGEIGVIPTDTVYGIVCSAFNKKSVEKIYEIKNRDLSKPLVFLIGEIKDLEKLNISLDNELKSIISRYWPGPVSIIFESKNIPQYLHRGMGGIAIRLPQNDSLREFLIETGPIATTSVNPESEPPATTIEEARAYFEGKDIDFYVNGGEINSRASKIIKIVDGEVEVIRE